MNIMTNAVATKPSAPEWLRELTTAKTGYEEDRGWPVSVDFSQRRLVSLTGTVVDVVIIPATLGEKVLTKPQNMMLTGPVITLPTGTWWTFLTQPATAARPEGPNALRTLKVHCRPHDATVVIAAHPDTTGTTAWRWIHFPQRDCPLSAWSTVIEAARHVAEARTAARAKDHNGQPSSVG